MAFRVPVRLLVAVAAYVAAVAGANTLTALYGLVPVGFGLSATAGTYAAGAALLVRDVLQDAGGRALVAVAIIAGAVASAVMATPRLAVASGAAFLIAEALDMAVYTPLRAHGWARAVIASNAAGAITDTAVFLALAGLPLLVSLPGQLAGKLLWATAIPVTVVIAARVVFRESLDAPHT